eukprot:CAMPEP_0197899810 /NCGR_PEP_ID=MMETSP1439-20131203/47450_1 /TAXON_ID=66791 /ORGANISM="Gonyaulax spinifera, Strain CCMP409" /LENGTH=362 /DNA_ID=CAMNT_0043520639 /DNA_START=59 /DNA_END=1143 /DNA_ORIENTATION=+
MLQPRLACLVALILVHLTSSRHSGCDGSCWEPRRESLDSIAFVQRNVAAGQNSAAPVVSSFEAEEQDSEESVPEDSDFHQEDSEESVPEDSDFYQEDAKPLDMTDEDIRGLIEENVKGLSTSEIDELKVLPEMLEEEVEEAKRHALEAAEDESEAQATVKKHDQNDATAETEDPKAEEDTDDPAAEKDVETVTATTSTVSTSTASTSTVTSMTSTTTTTITKRQPGIPPFWPTGPPPPTLPPYVPPEKVIINLVIVVPKLKVTFPIIVNVFSKVKDCIAHTVCYKLHIDWYTCYFKSQYWANSKTKLSLKKRPLDYQLNNTNVVTMYTTLKNEPPAVAAQVAEGDVPAAADPAADAVPAADA